uniref:Uncharacterized protein n=1 Tax=Oryza nivara TaxID=4536 RepID=A0A0E0G157_ORYNI
MRLASAVRRYPPGCGRAAAASKPSKAQSASRNGEAESIGGGGECWLSGSNAWLDELQRRCRWCAGGSWWAALGPDWAHVTTIPVVGAAWEEVAAVEVAVKHRPATLALAVAGSASRPNPALFEAIG